MTNNVSSDKKSSTQTATKTPRVSVVIVTRNVEEYLAEAVQSVLNQSYRDFELIILDFGSTDTSIEIARGFASADKRIRLEQVLVKEVVEARNAGCAFAQGEFIAVMDADDVSLAIRLEEQVAILDRSPAVGLVGGGAEWIDGKGRSMWILDFPAGDQEIKRELPRRFPFCHSAVTMRRSLFVKVGGYRPIFTTAHDYDLCLRLSEHCACANVEKPVVRYRVHGSQLSLSRRKQQTFCKLAAQASANARRSGSADPLQSYSEITSETLRQMGVSEAIQQENLVLDYCSWIHSIWRAGEDAVALKAAEEAFQLEWRPSQRVQIADLYLMTARLYWRKGQFLKTLRAALKAVFLRPALARNFLYPILWRLHIARGYKAQCE